MPHPDSATVIPRTAPMKGVLLAWRRALGSQFSGRMLLLSLVPLLLSLTLWGVAMWLGLQPLLDWLHGLFADYGGFDASNSMLGMVGLGMLKVMVVPLLAIALLLPLMIASSLLFMGILAMPAIERHVSSRHFPGLDKKEGGSFVGSLPSTWAARPCSRCCGYSRCRCMWCRHWPGSCRPVCGPGSRRA